MAGQQAFLFKRGGAEKVLPDSAMMLRQISTVMYMVQAYKYLFVTLKMTCDCKSIDIIQTYKINYEIEVMFPLIIIALSGEQHSSSQLKQPFAFQFYCVVCIQL